MATGEVLVMLNNDTEAEPEWLAALCQALEEHPEAGAAASKMLLFDRRDTLHSAGDMLGPDFMPQNRGVWEIDRGQYDDRIEIFGPCGGAAAYRREVWEQLGGFDERLFMYLEDVDLAWRMQRAGWKSVFRAGGPRLPSSQRHGRRGDRQLLRGPQHDLAAPPLSHPRPVAQSPARPLRKIVWEALRAWRGEAARARLRGIWHGLLGREGKGRSV